MNPFTPPSNDESDKSSVEPNLGDKITVACIGGCLNVAVLAVGGLVYYLFGWTGMHVVFIGIPLAFVLLLYLASRYPYQTSEARREYLREKRRKMRAENESS